ncbi:SRPBCC domain-containing protein [Reyranella sp. CPCC 100927]|uniref:SRPBCC family protein n=1 Tax=Reyranella sp. CPCC 100927 TaxID=2599616 RepID=UPI0011B40188|nr:SRPBCC domain-containing protein [Reyranella sp. CPCC 100927]TWT15596.1 SRPBCC domain-containing protein [Reyranella sp. CPCC 100927]
MASQAAVVARVTRRFSASAERVFDAWLDPAKAGTFLFATATGTMVRVDIDARIGGKFVFVDRRDGKDVPHTGEYLEIDRPRRLVFSLAVEMYAQDIDRVAIDIVPLASGCELTLTHEMRPDWAEHRDRIQAGWGEILEGLAITLGESEP